MPAHDGGYRAIDYYNLNLAFKSRARETASLWTLISLSLPWVPFMFIVFFIFIGALFFGAWWRSQKSYFA
jgi:hypothetical protein